MRDLQSGWAHAMTVRMSMRMGVVGSRAYEVQAWRSSGYGTLEQAVWAPSPETPVEKAPPRKSGLLRPLDAVAKVGSMIAALARSSMAGKLARNAREMPSQ